MLPNSSTRPSLIRLTPGTANYSSKSAVSSAKSATPTSIICIVQYLGVVQDQSTGLPILLMELLDDSLTHFLEQSEVQLPYYMQVNINYDIGQALAFLHANHIIHRDLSSNNVLLIGEAFRAKVTDFGMGKLTTHMTSLTKCPGTAVYMPPEAMLDSPVYKEELDCFQAGVLMVQTISRKYPDPGPAMNRVRNETSCTGWVKVIPETERRENHLRLVAATHPMYPLIVHCLKDRDTERPSARQICRQLSGLRDTPQYRQSHEARMGKGGGQNEKMREREEEAEGERENEEDREWEREREIQERDQIILQLREENEEKERLCHSLQNELDQECQVVCQQRRDMRELQESVSGQKQVLLDMDQLLQEKNAAIQKLQQAHQLPYHTSGPGIQSATVNCPTYALIQQNDSHGKCLQKDITAELELVTETTPIRGSWWPWSKATPDPTHKVDFDINTRSSTQLEVSYTPICRGQYKFHIQMKYEEIDGSPFTVIVYPDPTLLQSPVKTVTGMHGPYGIAFNSHGNMVVAECSYDQISMFNLKGQRIKSFGSKGSRPEDMIGPTGIAIDDKDNVYICSQYKLQKFSGSGELIKCVGQWGSKEGEFDDPHGLTLYKNEVYVCDCHNHRIQVFNMNLDFVRSFGSSGKGRGEFQKPFDVKFDSKGNMYVAELDNKRVQVFNSSGQFIRMIGVEGEGKLSLAYSVLIADQYVYVADDNRIVVYETSGQFVTSFGGRGQKEGEFKKPLYIASCTNGFIYVADSDNDRIQKF